MATITYRNASCIYEGSDKLAVDSLPDAAGWCAEHGWHELLWARTAGGQEFAFHDARHELGHLVELYEPSPAVRRLYAMVADAAADWDGSDPVRHLGARS